VSGAGLVVTAALTTGFLGVLLGYAAGGDEAARRFAKFLKRIPAEHKAMVFQAWKDSQ
jgi:hypothetical protein